MGKSMGDVGSVFWGLTGREIAFIFLTACLYLLFPQFGIGNQVEQFSLVQRMIDPNFAIGDFYIDSAIEAGQPRYYYSVFLAIVSKLVSLPTAVFTLSILTTGLVGMVSFRVAKQYLESNSIGAATAALLIMLNGGFSLGFAGYLVFDSYQPANLAVALGLAGYACLLGARPLLAAVWLGFSCMVHPTIGAELALVGFASTASASLLFRRPIYELKSLALGFTVFFSILAASWVLPNLSNHSEHISSTEFFYILATKRAPHHYLGLGFPLAAWASALIFLFATCLAIFLKHRKSKLTQPQFNLVVALIFVCGVCLISLLMVDVLHTRAFVTAQAFRMMLLVKWVGYLFLGWVIGDWLKASERWHFALIAGLLLPTGDAQPLSMMLVIITFIMLQRFELKPFFKWIISVSVLCLCIVLQLKLGVEKQTVRILVCLFLFTCLFALKSAFRVRLLLAVTLTIASAGMAYSTRINGFLGQGALVGRYSWDDHQSDADKIAREAGRVTPAGAVVLAPPDFESFRSLSNRALLADFTSIPFEDAAMKTWEQRMLALYGAKNENGFAWLRAMKENYRQAPNLNVARAYGATYAVIYSPTPVSEQVVAKNDTYKLVRLK